MTDRVGQKLGNYHLVRLLGRGGFADVYLAEHIHLKSLAAIKILCTRLTDELRESFLSEARILAHLTHPHIIRTLDFGLEPDGVPFLVMDYAPHGTIRQRHPSHTKVPLPIVIEDVKQIADALQYAHNQRLIHRDLKPDNILIGQNNELLLSDFGVAMISQATTHPQTGEKNIIGTMTYMAPEQLQGKPLFASDQYSLGVMVYEWLCGTRPFQGTVVEVFNQHLSVPPAPLRQHVPELSPLVEQVILTALAKDPHRRFPNISMFAAELEKAAQPGASLLLRDAALLSMTGISPNASTLLGGGAMPTAMISTPGASTLSDAGIVPPTLVAPPDTPVPSTPDVTTDADGVVTPPIVTDSDALTLDSDEPVPPTVNALSASEMPTVAGTPAAFATPEPVEPSWAARDDLVLEPELRAAWLSNTPSPVLELESLLDRPAPLRRPPWKMLLLVGVILLALLGTSVFAASALQGHGSGIAGVHNSGTQGGSMTPGDNNGLGNKGPGNAGPGSTPTSGSTSVPPAAVSPTAPPKSAPTPTPTPKPGCTYDYGWELNPDGGTTGSHVFTVSGHCGGAVYATPASAPAYPTQMRIMYLLPGATYYSYGSWINFPAGKWIELVGGLPAKTQFKLQARNSGSANYYTIHGNLKY